MDVSNFATVLFGITAAFSIIVLLAMILNFINFMKRD